MDINKILQSKIFSIVFYTAAALMVLLVVFKAGMIVGALRSDFMGKWAENYHKNFGGPQVGFMEMAKDDNFLEANGTFGKIIKIEANIIVVQAGPSAEKAILVDADTVIKSFKETIKLQNLKVGELIVVIGEPNSSGQIVAKLIRRLPPPEPMGMGPQGLRKW